MVTAKMQDEDVLTGYQHGADYYITKPCTAKQLLYGIGLVLDRAVAGGETTVAEDKADVGRALTRRSRRWTTPTSRCRHTAWRSTRLPDRVRGHRRRRQVDADPPRRGGAANADGHRVELTVEPGGTALGTQLRELLLHDARGAAPLAELFLYLADRAQHVGEVIAPGTRGRRGRADRSLLGLDDRLPGIWSRTRPRRRDQRRRVGARRRCART